MRTDGVAAAVSIASSSHAASAGSADVPAILASNPILSALWIYWRSKSGCRSMPRRADIDPTEIPQLLPNLQLVERIDGRFRYRLCGSAIVAAYGRELTGRFVDEVIPRERLAIAEMHYTTVYETRRAIFVRNKYTTTKSIDLIASRCILPLSEDDRSVTMLLMAQTFEHGSHVVAGLANGSTLAPYCGRIELL
jgi:hypothetical protein